MLSPSFQRAVRPAINHTRALTLVPRTGSRWINPFQRAHVVPSPTISPILELRTKFSTKPPLQPNKIDRQHEKEIAQQELEARPGEVSTQSSVRHVIESSQAPPGPERDMTVDIKNDINTIKETFALGAVPRQPYLLGLAGTLPYLATSLSTVFLSWNINTQWPTDSNFLNSILFSNEAATHWLHVLEPLQVGYGAVLISFLGAIHWGMEFVEKQPSHNRTVFRYATGVIAPLVAWPTTLMSIEFALTTQFLAFVSLYFVDSRAMVRGWAPTWYQTYRFVLTAIVGAAILISLVSRTKIGASHARLSSPELQDLLSQKPPGGQEYHNWAKEEEEERKRLREEKKREEEKKRQEEEKKKKAENKKGKEKGGKTPESTKDKSGENNKTEEKNGKKDDGEKQDSGDKQAEEEDKQPVGEKKAGEDTKKRDQEDKRDQKDGKQSGKQTSKRDDDQSR